jgi:hypothetical protein
MRQLLVLNADELNALKRGEHLPLTIAGETIVLTSDAGMNGAPSPPRATSSIVVPDDDIRASIKRRKPNQPYTDVQRRYILDAIHQGQQQGRSQRDVCNELGISDSLIYQWRQRFETNP